MKRLRPPVMVKYCENLVAVAPVTYNCLPDTYKEMRDNRVPDSSATDPSVMSPPRSALLKLAVSHYHSLELFKKINPMIPSMRMTAIYVQRSTCNG